MEKNIQQLKYAEVTEKVIKAAFKVHSFIGSGFPEDIYQRSLLTELNEMGLQCESEMVKDIFFYSQKVGSRRLDLLVEVKILLELKAINEMDNYQVN